MKITNSSVLSLNSYCLVITGFCGMMKKSKDDSRQTDEDVFTKKSFVLAFNMYFKAS